MIIETRQLNKFMGALQIPLPKGSETALEKLEGYLAKGKTLTVEIKLKKPRRSLDANACMWAMLRDMAMVLHTTDKELYLVELEKYGVCDYISCPEEAVERIKSVYRLVIERGNTWVNGYKMKVLQVFPGSSTYNTKEFSVLLDGVINDAKELGVDYISPADRDLILKELETKNDGKLNRMD